MNYLRIVVFILLFTVSAQAQSATVITENANLRGTPNQSGKIVTTLGIGAALEVIKQSGSWFLVQSDEYAGWMHGNTIRYEANATTFYGPPVTKKSKPLTKRSASSQYYIRGPRGGCYYLNSNGNKTYVDRNLCN